MTTKKGQRYIYNEQEVVVKVGGKKESVIQIHGLITMPVDNKNLKKRR